MTSMTIFALTEPEQRGQNYFFYAMADTLKVHEVYVMSVNNIPATPLRKKIKKAKYIIIQHYSISQKEDTNYIRLTTDQSKIFQTGSQFEIPKQHLDDFYNPKICTIPEALASPKKRRLSVEGVISEVYPIKEGQNWRRRDIILEDPPTNKKICCKLWNQMADNVDEEHKGSTAKLVNMEVDIYNSRHQLRTTGISSLTISTPNNGGKYHIIGADIEENNITLITECGETFEIDESTLATIDMSPADFIAITPIDAQLHIQNSKITEIQIEN